MSDPLEILCFSDALCVWAYAGNRRFEQLEADFADRVRVTYHFISVYGDVRRRLDRSGKTDAQYAAQIRSVADRFDHVEVHPEVFTSFVPASSMPAHLYLRAVKLLEDEGALAVSDGSVFRQMLWDVRVAFFRDGVDVSKAAELDAIAERHGVSVAAVREVFASGRAHAELDHDARLVREHKVPVSPSLVLNEGRQLLNGNVGYRVIEANVRELLERPAQEASWC